MNYSIIPKNNFNTNISLNLTTEDIKPYISYSLFYYLNDIYKQLFKLDTNTNLNKEQNINDININDININDININELNIELEYINKIVNPFEFIHTNVPGSILSVSKVKPDASIFFELIEIFQLCNLHDFIITKNKINIAHLTPNYTSTNYILNMLREENNDYIITEDFDYTQLYNMFITNKFEKKLDLIICEFKQYDYNNKKKYNLNMLLVLIIIIKYQSNNGTCIIKIDNLFYKGIIDILLLLSSFYDKVIIVKPIISNITKGERYIVCKTFNSNTLEHVNITNQLEELIPKINNIELLRDKYIVSLINEDIPYHFLNKLEESNAIIGQQQLEAYDLMINIFKNKNRDEKMDILKRHNIQKCIQWCEKNQLPHNKFIDKVNIFLTPKKNEIEYELKDEIT